MAAAPPLRHSRPPESQPRPKPLGLVRRYTANVVERAGQAQRPAFPALARQPTSGTVSFNPGPPNRLHRDVVSYLLTVM